MMMLLLLLMRLALLSDEPYIYYKLQPRDLAAHSPRFAMEKSNVLPSNGRAVAPGIPPSLWKSAGSAIVLTSLLSLVWPMVHPPLYRNKLTRTEFDLGLRQCARANQHPFVDYSYPSFRLDDRNTSAPITFYQNATLINGDGQITHEVDIEIQDGIIVHVGQLDSHSPDALVVDVAGRYLSPGLIDMHSHVGVRQEPQILMNEDVSETSQPVTPMGRAIDGFKPSDRGIKIVASGGTTTSLVLTGASNLISGEGMLVKHKDSMSVWELQVDTTNGGSSPKPQRYLKMACGENTKQKFQNTRTGPVSREGESIHMRRAFEEAQNLRLRQDAWCEHASTGGAHLLDEPYPTSLQWQTLVDVLRGDIGVHVHCYQSQDVFSEFDHADEFGYNITALHHVTQAHEMLDEIKKRGTMLATFSDEGGFKNENYHASWYMNKLAAAAGIPLALTTDHPAKHGQFFALEAQIAHHFQLDEKLAIASLTSVPAKAMGVDNRYDPAVFFLFSFFHNGILKRAVELAGFVQDMMPTLWFGIPIH